MPYYNISTMGNGSSFSSYLNDVSTLTGGFFYQMILLIVAVVVFMAMSAQAYPTEENLIVAGFVTSILTILFWAAGFLGLWILGPCLVVMFIGIGSKAMK